MCCPINLFIFLDLFFNLFVRLLPFLVLFGISRAASTEAAHPAKFRWCRRWAHRVGRTFKQRNCQKVRTNVGPREGDRLVALCDVNSNNRLIVPTDHQIRWLRRLRLVHLGNTLQQNPRWDEWGASRVRGRGSERCCTRRLQPSLYYGIARWLM